MSDKFRYTIQHINNEDILVNVYKKGERKIYYRFFVADNNDWNAVDDYIEQRIALLEQHE